MMKLVAFLTVALFGLSMATAFSGFDDEYVNKVMELAGKEYYDGVEEPAMHRAIATDRNFNCRTNVKYTKATSVHSLRPNDIEIIGAFGDSITAGNGANAKSVLGLLQEDRGVSWSIGGEKDLSTTFTLANLIKKFNPNLIGFATGSGKSNAPTAGFNTAIPGSTTLAIGDQAKELVRRIKEVPKQADKWKMVTLFIGGNDLCKYCEDKKTLTVDTYVSNIKAALDYLKENLPRTMVNLVQTLDVSTINDMNKLTCIPLQVYLCSCAMKKENYQEVVDLVKGMQEGTSELVASGRYDTDSQFTVVAHPFMTKMKPPRTSTGAVDYSFFSYDCFHMSRKGHEQLAQELWNSLLTPVGKKQTEWKFVEGALFCPTEKNPFFYTRINSNTSG